MRYRQHEIGSLSHKGETQGFRSDPPSSKYWSFEELLESKLKSETSGDVDLRQFTSPRHDQRSTSSCVGQSVVKALEIKRIMKLGRSAHVDLSILAVYFLARELMSPSEVGTDSGTYISLACDVLRRFGVCPEKDWPFDMTRICISPSWKAMRKAYLHKISSFYRINSIGQDRVEKVVKALQSNNPVVYGTSVGQNWFSYRKDQVLSQPKAILGRHATVLLGYENGKFIGENSWGTKWGGEGFYYMDPAVISSSESRDFWVIQEGFEEYKS